MGSLNKHREGRGVGGGKKFKTSGGVTFIWYSKSTRLWVMKKTRFILIFIYP